MAIPVPTRGAPELLKLWTKHVTAFEKYAALGRICARVVGLLADHAGKFFSAVESFCAAERPGNSSDADATPDASSAAQSPPSVEP